MGYKNVYTKTIVKEENIPSLWDAYNETPHVEWAHQDWNLFNLEKRSMNRTFWKKYAAIRDIDDYMFQTYGCRTHVHYFLKYVPESFTRVHQDNKDTVTKTVITFLEESPDLEGGNTLFFDKHFNSTPSEDAINKGKDGDGMDIIPLSVKLPQYQSLIYNWNVPHGVSLVEKGHRIVLVSWYVAG